MKKIVLPICCVVVVCVTGVLFAGCFGNEAPQKRIERLTGITLPSDMVVMFYQVGHYGFVAGSPPRFVVDPPYFVLFKLQGEPTEFLGRLGFLSSSHHNFGTVVRNLSEEYAFESYMWHLSHYRPPGTSHSNVCFIVYFPDRLELAIWMQGQY